MAKKLVENKMLLVLLCKDKAESDKQVEVIGKFNPIIPQDFTCSIHLIIGKKNFAAAFNDVQKKSDAKYKIYFTSPLAHLDKSILMKTLEAFFLEPKTALVGTIGSEIPVDGDYIRAKNFYGLYNYFDETGQMQQYLGKDPLMYQSVHMVENSFFATNEDLTWDEKIGDEFALAAQCCNFRAKGADVGVFYQEKPLLTFAKDEFGYNPKADSIGYNNQLQRFRTFYAKKFQPLVSILIPTYNQPKFCQEALESALGQTYQNIEILVGDDSKNEDTKNMIRPYLKKHSNLKYFFHDGKKIARGGGENMLFLLNECSGEFVNYLLHDDLFQREKISKMMQYYITDFENRIGLVTSARSLIDENDNYLSRKNPWQPRSDAIIKGDDVGRRLLFIIANFIGELTTALFRKNDVMLKKNRFNEKRLFSMGNFCGTRSASYGDVDTWLEILKTGKDMVFMSESLSAFRKHSAQNTYNPNTRIALPLDALNFITVSWLNDVFFRNEDEFHYCLKKWPIMAERWFVPIKDDDQELTKKRKEWLIKIREIFAGGDYAKMTDVAISYMMQSTYYSDNKRGRLIRKNLITGLWEKNTLAHLETKEIDECNHVWQMIGNPSLKENDNKFGAAFDFDGETWLTLNENFKFGGKDFAVAGWAYLPDCNTNGTIFCISSAYNCRYDFSVTNVSGAKFRHCLVLKDFSFCDTTAHCTENLFHFELDYKQSSRTLFLFVNGKKIYENIFEKMATPQMMTMLKIGSHCNNGVWNLVGRIEEFIFTEKLLHDEEFTPPDKRYEKDKFTKVLLHFDKKKFNQ